MSDVGPWPVQPSPMPPPVFGPGAPPPVWGGPPGWGPPPPGPPQYGWQPEPPQPPRKRSRIIWVLPILLVVVVIAAVGGYWGYSHHQREQQLAQIRETVTAFADASDTADAAKMATLMCADEAAEFSDGFQGRDDGGTVEPAERRPVDIGDITLTGDDAATVAVTRPPAAVVTLKLTREGGSWKVCNPS